MIGHDYWRSDRAIDEIEVYCDLLDILGHRRADQDKQGRKGLATLLNVEAVIGSYGLEIGMKSLWALDNPKGIVKKLGHNIEKVHDGLKPATVDSLRLLGLTREVLAKAPKPFESNRYSMECGNRKIAVFDAGFLRQLRTDAKGQAGSNEEGANLADINAPCSKSCSGRSCYGVGPLRAFSSCLRRLADSRLRQRSRSLEHSGEHVVVRGKAMCRAGWIGAGHMEQVSGSIGLTSRSPRA